MSSGREPALAPQVEVGGADETDGLADALAPQPSGLVERLLGREGAAQAQDLRGVLPVAGVGPVQSEHVGEVPVDDGDDLERGPAPGPRHAVQDGQGLGRGTPVDGVGQVPRGHRPGLPQEGLELAHPDGRPLAVGRGQGVEHPGQPSQVLTQVLAQALGGGRVQAHGSVTQVLGQPLRPVAGVAHGDVDHLADRVHGLDQGLRHRAAPAHQHQHARRGRVGQGRRQPGRVGRVQPTGLPDDHHPPVDQEGRGGEGVDHRAHLEVVTGRLAAVLLDHEGGVPLAHQLGDEGPGGLGDQRRILAAHQVDGKHRPVGRGHRSSRRVTPPRSRRPACRAPGGCRPRRGP